MPNVKGTMLVEFVKTIRADRTGAYNSLLTDQDKKIISQRILSTQWYPFETYKNCFGAVVKVVAKGDMEMVRQWGRIYSERIITDVYRTLIDEQNPAEMIKKYQVVIKHFYDFGKIEMELLSQTSALVKMSELASDFEPFFHVSRGWLERSLELAGAKNVKSEFLAKSWQGAPETIIKFSWTG